MGGSAAWHTEGGYTLSARAFTSLTMMDVDHALLLALIAAE